MNFTGIEGDISKIYPRINEPVRLDDVDDLIFVYLNPGYIDAVFGICILDTFYEPLAHLLFTYLKRDTVRPVCDSLAVTYEGKPVIFHAAYSDDGFQGIALRTSRDRTVASLRGDEVVEIINPVQDLFRDTAGATADPKLLFLF